MKSKLVLGFSLALAAGVLVVAARRADAQAEFARTFEVDPQKYLGMWFEVARSPNDFEDNLPKLRGEKYGPCTSPTARYAAISWNKISVQNSCERAAIDDISRLRVDGVTGLATIQRNSANRKLKVAFGPKVARFFQRIFTGGGADYWIYGIGPENDEGLYSWALVSGPARDNIFILSRTKELPQEQLAEILELAKSEHLPVSQLIYTRK